jgi:hypothetical protein
VQAHDFSRAEHHITLNHENTTHLVSIQDAEIVVRLGIVRVRLRTTPASASAQHGEDAEIKSLRLEDWKPDLDGFAAEFVGLVEFAQHRVDHTQVVQRLSTIKPQGQSQA